jgi:hypothetical protein
MFPTQAGMNLDRKPIDKMVSIGYATDSAVHLASGSGRYSRHLTPLSHHAGISIAHT